MHQQMHEGFSVPPLRKQAIVNAAQHARKVLALPDGAIDAGRLLDQLTVFGIYYDVLDRAVDFMPAGVEACYLPEDRTIYIRDAVHAQMCRPGTRAQFTLGHELGHAVLAHRRTFNRQAANVPIYCNSEWQANTFAAEFLMPVELVKKHQLSCAADIADYFGVSQAAARNRWESIAKEKSPKA